MPACTAAAAKCDSLLRRAALPVDRRRRDALGQPADSQAVRAMSSACAPTWSTQPKITSSTARVDRRPLHERPQHVRAEVGRVDLAEAAAAPADGGTDSFDDVCLGHGSSSLSSST